MPCEDTKADLDAANADFAASLDQRQTARQEHDAATAALAEADAALNAADLRVSEASQAQISANNAHNECLVSN